MKVDGGGEPIINMLLWYSNSFTVSGTAMLRILHVGCLIVFSTDTVNLCHLYHHMLNSNKH